MKIPLSDKDPAFGPRNTESNDICCSAAAMRFSALS